MAYWNHPDHSGLQVREAEQQTPGLEPYIEGKEACLNGKRQSSVERNDREQFPQSNGLEVLLGTESKEAVHRPEGKLQNGRPASILEASAEKELLDGKRNGRHSAWRQPKRRLRIMLGAVALVVAIVIAVPIGTVYSRHNNATDATIASPAASTTPAPTPSGAPESIPIPNVFSTSGAWNGTGLAAIPASAGSDSLLLFYQDYTGSLKMTAMNGSGSWSGGQDMGVHDVANASGLAALTHFTGENNKTTLTHVMYTTSEGFLADVIQTNGSGSWEAGSLITNQIIVPSPSLHRPSRLTAIDGPGGVSSLFAAGARFGWITEFMYYPANNTWERNHVLLNTNGYGGMSAQYASNLTTLYALTSENKLESWWRDFGAVPPIWQHNLNVADASLYDNSSITAPGQGADTDLLYYQSPTGEMQAYTISGIEDNAKWNSTTSTNANGVPGSNMCACALQVSGSDFETHLFIQEGGNDVQHYVGGKAAFTKQPSLNL